MKSKIAIYSVFAIGAMALFGATLATTSAASPGQYFSQPLGMGNGVGFDKMMESKADVLGMSVDEIKDMHNDGIMLHDILEDKGIDMDEFHDKMMENHKEFLQEQVSAGNITQEQADKRLEWMEKRHEEGPREKGAMHRGMHRGQGRGLGHGFQR